jgi:hypothetical protein
MFASKTIAAHMLRGVIAAALIAWALLYQSSNPAFAVAAAVGAVAAMRGCPMCWTVGLLETIAVTIRVRRADTCSSGRCSLPGAARPELVNQ